MFARSAILMTIMIGSVHARQSVLPLPELATYELAEQARVRPLTAAEVQAVTANELAAFVYFEAALSRSGAAPLLPASPARGCLAAPLHDLLAARQDGVWSAAELQGLTEAHQERAHFAYLVATGGVPSPVVVAKLAEIDRLREATEHPIAKYFELLAAEPSLPGNKIDYYRSNLSAAPGLAIARYIELGGSLRDALVARVAATAAPTPNTGARLGYKALLIATVYALAAVSDSRLQAGGALDAADEAMLHSSMRRYLAKARAAAGRDISMEKAAAFWRVACQ